MNTEKIKDEICKYMNEFKFSDFKNSKITGFPGWATYIIYNAKTNKCYLYGPCNTPYLEEEEFIVTKIDFGEIIEDFNLKNLLTDKYCKEIIDYYNLDKDDKSYVKGIDEIDDNEFEEIFKILHEDKYYEILNNEEQNEFEYWRDYVIDNLDYNFLLLIVPLYYL